MVNIVLHPEIDLPFLEGSLDEPRKLAAPLARGVLRHDFSTLFALDHQLGRIVSSTNEVILGQMRLAWWRDQLKKDVTDRPNGNKLLEQLSICWAGREQTLIALVNGWEELLASEGFDEELVQRFALGRSRPFYAIAKHANIQTDESLVNLAAMRWALFDLAQHSSSPELRGGTQALVRNLGNTPSKLPIELRPLILLDRLTCRAMKKGIPSLLGDRFSPIVALRFGIFGK